MGKVDKVEEVSHDVNSSTGQVRFRFKATPQQVSAIAVPLNLVPYAMHSVTDHGLKHGRNDPDWWAPETELTCCTLYRGLDKSGKARLLLGYNSNLNVAYAVVDTEGTTPPRTGVRITITPQ